MWSLTKQVKVRACLIKRQFLLLSGLRKWVPANLAWFPSSSSIRRSWLYLAKRSLRHGAPVFIWWQQTRTFTWGGSHENVHMKRFTWRGSHEEVHMRRLTRGGSYEEVHMRRYTRGGSHDEVHMKRTHNPLGIYYRAYMATANWLDRAPCSVDNIGLMLFSNWLGFCVEQILT